MAIEVDAAPQGQSSQPRDLAQGLEFSYIELNAHTRKVNPANHVTWLRV